MEEESKTNQTRWPRNKLQEQRICRHSEYTWQQKKNARWRGWAKPLGYHWRTEYIQNHSLMTWHRRHIFSSARALVNYKPDSAQHEFSIFMVFRLSHWYEDGKSKLMKCPKTILSILRARWLNLQFLKTAFILKRGATKWVAHAPDFVFSRFVHIPLKHKIHQKSFFNDLTSDTQIFKRKGTNQLQTWFCTNCKFSIFMVFRLGHWYEDGESQLMECPNNDFVVMYCGRVY